nr:hypothetical protein [Ruminiclostridium sp.]
MSEIMVRVGSSRGTTILVDDELSLTSENPVQNKVITAALGGKANTADLAAVATSGSYNDLSNKPAIPAAVTVDSALSAVSDNPVQNKVITAALGGKANTEDLAVVATSGSYNDLSNKPTIPAAVTVDSALSSVSENPVQNKVITTALGGKANTADLAAVATSGSYNDLSNKPTIPAAVTVDSTLSSVSENPVQNKVITTALGGKANTADLAAVATSGSYNDLSDKPAIPAGVIVDSTLSSVSENPVQNKVITAALGGKANTADLAAVATSGSYNDLSNKPTIPAAVTVDSALSSVSENPVQNKVITAALAACTYRETVLYQDDMGGTDVRQGTTITLSQAFTNFDEIIIEWGYTQNNYYETFSNCWRASYWSQIKEYQANNPNKTVEINMNYYNQCGYICFIPTADDRIYITTVAMAGGISRYIT